MVKVSRLVAIAGVLSIVAIAALPVASYAATESEPVTVSLAVTDGLTIAGADGNPSTALMSYNHNYGAASNAADSTGTASNANHGTITILCNVAAGYTLTLADADTNTNLVGTPSGMIPTQAGLPVAGTPGWSVAVSPLLAGAAGSGTLGAWAAMPASNGTPITVGSTTTVSASAGDQYDYAFATAISASTVAGTYTDTVTFTATSK